MSSHLITSPSWSTASFGETTLESQPELSALAEHLDRCRRANGRVFAVLCVAETMNGFVAARFVTTLAVVTLLIGVSLLVL